MTARIAADTNTGMNSGLNQRGIFCFRLYVAGDTLNSTQAIANLAALCCLHLPDRHQVEVVDVLKFPERALEDKVFVTPTLLKLTPDPVRRIVGTLSATDVILSVLGLEGRVS